MMMLGSKGFWDSGTIFITLLKKQRFLSVTLLTHLITQFPGDPAADDGQNQPQKKLSGSQGGQPGE